MDVPNSGNPFLVQPRLATGEEDPTKLLLSTSYISRVDIDLIVQPFKFRGKVDIVATTTFESNLFKLLLKCVNINFNTWGTYLENTSQQKNATHLFTSHRIRERKQLLVDQ